MTRVKGGPSGHRRHKKLLDLARGYDQGRHRLYKRAHEAVINALADQYRDRRRRKRDFRRLWIQRINAAARHHGVPYGRFMHGLILAGVQIDRKSLAELAARDPQAFAALVKVAADAG